MSSEMKSGFFLEQEGTYQGENKFGEEDFLLKLAYLSDIFGKLNELNLQLQGRDKHLPDLRQNQCLHSQAGDVGQAT